MVSIVLLICYVCFDFLVQAQDTQDQGSLISNRPVMSRAFRVEAKQSKISWTMRKPFISAAEKSSPILRSVEFISTLDIGWIPDDVVDFFGLFVLDLHKKWRQFLEKADLHLDASVSTSPPTPRNKNYFRHSLCTTFPEGYFCL